MAKSSTNIITKSIFFTLAALLMIILNVTFTDATSPVTMGSAENFGVLAGSTATNIGPTVIMNDFGLSPGTSITGFPPGMVNGAAHVADSVALEAQVDLTAAYLDAAGRTPSQSIPSELGGLTLNPGVYTTGSSFMISSGDLTLDAQGDPEAVFIFQVPSSLTTISGTRILLINEADPCNVFWQVGSSATLGTDSIFKGTILALTSITLTADANLEGRVLARNGAVTLDSNNIYLTCGAGGGETICGDGVKNDDEECDDSSNNGIECAADCESSCNYCDSDCTTKTNYNQNSCSGGETPPVPEFSTWTLGLAVIGVGLGLVFLRRHH